MNYQDRDLRSDDATCAVGVGKVFITQIRHVGRPIYQTNRLPQAVYPGAGAKQSKRSSSQSYTSIPTGGGAPHLQIISAPYGHAIGIIRSQKS